MRRLAATSSRYTIANLAKRENLSIRQTYQRVLGSASGGMVIKAIQSKSRTTWKIGM